MDRRKPVSPDVSRFITPVDPADDIEEDIVDEVPYVPHVPVKPPPPARFANRRKLYDETAVVSEDNFGDGVSSDAGEESSSSDDIAVEFSQETTSNGLKDLPENIGREQRRPQGRRRGRGGSNDGDRPSETQRTPQAQRSSESERSTDRSQEGSPGGNANPSRSRESDRAAGSERSKRNDRPPRNSRPARNDRQGNSSSNRNQGSNRRTNDGKAPATPSETRSLPGSAEDAQNKVTNSNKDSDLTFPDDAMREDSNSVADPATPQGEGRPRRSRRRGRRRGPRPEGGGE